MANHPIFGCSTFSGAPSVVTAAPTASMSEIAAVCTPILSFIRAHPSFDELIRPDQQGLRDRQSKRLGGLEVDHELELGRLLHRKVGGLGAFKDPVRVDGAGLE